MPARFVRGHSTRVLSSRAKELLGDTAILNFIDGELNPLRLGKRGRKTSMFRGKSISTDVKAAQLKKLGSLDSLIRFCRSVGHTTTFLGLS